MRGAIKTDFILSAEIMTIALSVIEAPSLWMQAATLAVVGIAVTIAVYGTVALIVKMDDVGLYLATNARLGVTQAVGRGLVAFMPKLLWLLTVIGTAAMLWVGGSIMLHGAYDLGFGLPYDTIHHWAVAAAHGVSEQLQGAVEWGVTALADGIFGLAYGLVLIPIATRVIGPLIKMVSGKPAAH